jgi:hypothetical protein
MHRSVRFPSRLLVTVPLVVLLGAAGPGAAAPSPAPAPSGVAASTAPRSALSPQAPSADRDPSAKLPGLRCNPRKTPLRCDIYAKYRGWLAYLNYVGKPNPNARWSKREARYLRNHRGMARRLGPTDVFRHPGKRGFVHQTRTRRDRRHQGIPAQAFARGGGPNYCTTLTIKRKIESSIFRFDLFTAYHKTRWCWDDNVVYDQGEGNWTEIAVHDRFAVVNEGAIASYEGGLPTRGSWYSSQQWKICNCAFRVGAVGFWQPMWQVWAKPGGRYDWRAHW